MKNLNWALCGIAWILVALPATASESLMAHFIEACSLWHDPEAKVYYMELDVTGDKSNEIFLSSEESKGVAGQQWCVYTRGRGMSGQQGSFEYLGRIFFHLYGFYYDLQSGQFFVWKRLRGKEGRVVSFRFDSEGVHRVTTGEWSSSGDDAASLEKLESKMEAWQAKMVEGREKMGEVSIFFKEYKQFYEKKPEPWRSLSTGKPVEKSVPDLMAAKVVDGEE